MKIAMTAAMFLDHVNLESQEKGAAERQVQADDCRYVYRDLQHFSWFSIQGA